MNDIATEIRNLPRQGAAVDEPEGARWLEMSDTLANQLADELERLTLLAGKRRCRAQKQGEYDDLRCVYRSGHEGEHSYAVKEQR